MPNNAMTFIFDNNQIEVLSFNNVILFSPYQIGECLELTNSSVRMAVRKMNKNQVIKLTNSDVKDIDIRKLNNAGENFLTESGVYKLIFKSQKPDAERLQDWLADEVIPQVRQTGGYIPMQGSANEPPLSEKDIMAKGYIIAMKTIDMRNQQIENMQKQLEKSNNDLIEAGDKILTLEPKGEYYDKVLQSGRGVNITTVASAYGISGQKLNDLLHTWGIQYKRFKRWFLYEEHKQKGWTLDDTFAKDAPNGGILVNRTMKWTEIGIEAIYQEMKSHGYKTLSEIEEEKALKQSMSKTTQLISDNFIVDNGEKQLSMLEEELKEC